MPPVQTTYNNAPAIAIEGMVADASRRSDVMSYVANESIPAGRLVVRQAAGRCKLPTLTTDITSGIQLGLAMYDATKVPGVYVANEMVPVLRAGRAYVVVEEAVTEGDGVFVRFASGAGGTGLGAFRRSADTATAVQLPGAVYRSTAALGGLAIVEFNMP